MASEAEKAYFAGFFDGEGMVGIYRRGLYPMRIVNTDPTPLMRARELWGGYISTRYRSQMVGANQDIWAWTLAGAGAVPFLMDVYPYLIVKRAQVDLFLEVVRVLPVGRGRRRAPGVTDLIEANSARMRLLKRGAA